jgi:hypothetical protein
MSHSLGIVYLHHDINDVVLNNLASIQRQNPKAIVDTISARAALPGGYALEATPEIKHLHAAKPSKSSDWLLCSWFLQRRERCRKWWIIEWDTYCAISAREYYDAVWDYPLVASSVRVRHRDSNYGWFSEVGKMPAEYQPYAMAIAPFCCLIDEEPLRAICETLLQQPFTAANGETRFATVANWLGWPPCGFSPPNDHIGWKPWVKLAPQRTIYHPVKHLVNPKDFEGI